MISLLQVEDPKKALLLYGGRTSQVVKDVLSDFGKLKGVSGGMLLLDSATHMRCGLGDFCNWVQARVAAAMCTIVHQTLTVMPH